MISFEFEKNKRNLNNFSHLNIDVSIGKTEFAHPLFFHSLTQMFVSD